MISEQLLFTLLAAAIIYGNLVNGLIVYFHVLTGSFFFGYLGAMIGFVAWPGIESILQVRLAEYDMTIVALILTTAFSVCISAAFNSDYRRYGGRKFKVAFFMNNTYPAMLFY